MGKSSISKHLGRGAGSAFALALGDAVRTRRRRLGLTQLELGHPLSKGFVSAVEHGRTLPSLGAIHLIAERLELPLHELLADVNDRLSEVYTPAHEQPANDRSGWT